MNSIITLPRLSEMLSQVTSTDKRYAEKFLVELTSIIAEGITTEGYVRIKGIGTFRRILVGDKSKVEFVPEKEMSDTINKPFSFFEPVEMADGVSADMLDQEEPVMPPVIDSAHTETKDTVTAPFVETISTIEIESPAVPVPEPKAGETPVEPETEAENTPVGPEPEAKETPVEPEPETEDTPVESEPETEDTPVESEPEAEDTPVGPEPEAEDIPVEPKPEAEDTPVEPEPETEEIPAKHEPEEISEEPKVEEATFTSAPEPLESPTEPEPEVEEPTSVPAFTATTQAPEYNYQDDYDYGDEGGRRRPWFAFALWFIGGLLIGFCVGYFCHDQISMRTQSAQFFDYSQDADDNGEEVVSLLPPRTQEEETDTTVIDLNDSEEGYIFDDPQTTGATTDQPATETKTEPETQKPSSSDEPVYDTVTENRVLSSMARDHYGNRNYWIYIYLENKDVIKDPNMLRPGTKLRIPPKSKYDISDNEEENLDNAKKMISQVMNEFNKK